MCTVTVHFLKQNGNIYYCVFLILNECIIIIKQYLVRVFKIKCQIRDKVYIMHSIFPIHFRLFHLVISLGFQILIMRDMEKLTGSIRMTIIYVGSGIAGNLASCIFVPYQVEVRCTCQIAYYVQVHLKEYPMLRYISSTLLIIHNVHKPQHICLF